MKWTDTQRIAEELYDLHGDNIDPKTVRCGAGFINMRNRISMYNGKINIYSELDRGTEITIEIELK